MAAMGRDLAPIEIGFVSQNLLRLFDTLALAQAHTRAAAIFVDEFDARYFKGTSEFICCTDAAAICPSTDSNRAMVGSEIDECSAKSPCDQPSKARAALICRVVTNFSSL